MKAPESKRRTELLWLAYSPLWMAAMGVVMLTGWYRSWSDAGFLLFGLALGAPPWLLPWLWPGDPEGDRPFWQRHWFRANLWIAALVFVGSFFVTHYFFQVMGMRYGFPVHWNLQATVVGGREGRVPLFLYPVTHAYFTTYFAVMVVAWRAFRRHVSDHPLASAALVIGLSYVVAWAETFFMASGIIADVFLYASRERMLTYGSVFYGCLFAVSLPLFARLDEPLRAAASAGPPPSARGLVAPLVESLGAGMGAMILLELWAAWIGPLSSP